MIKKMLKMFCLVALGLGFVPALTMPVAAQDATEKKKPNDATVRVIMGLAFAAVPETVKGKDGKEKVIDRSDPKKFLIPLDDARRVIRASMLSANAHVCDLNQLEAKNFREMMAREKALGKWSANNLIFIKYLHISTGLVISGTFKIDDKTVGKDKDQEEEKSKRKCSPDERKRVTANIEAYLKKADTKP